MNSGIFVAIPSTDTSESPPMQMNWEDYARELATEVQDPNSNELKGPIYLGLSATNTSRLKNEGTYATQEWCVRCILERMIPTEHALKLQEGKFTSQAM